MNAFTTVAADKGLHPTAEAAWQSKDIVGDWSRGIVWSKFEGTNIRVVDRLIDSTDLQVVPDVMA